jgi:PAS domain S-box-containing protein
MPEIKCPIRLLHLEDCPRDAELIINRLEAGGLISEIVRVDDQQAFEAALLNQAYDLVLCDYNLPGYDGFAALKQVRKTQPHAPVIIISGSIGEEEAVECLHLGATDYLLKERLERLVPAVKRALAESKVHYARRQAEEKLRDSEERFRQLAEQSSEGFWFVGLNPERTLYVSPALERIWAQPAERYYHEPRAWLDNIHPDDQASVMADWKDCLEGRADRFEVEYRIVRPDQSVRWVLGSGVPIRDGQGDTVRMGGMVRDITERKQIETQMLRTQRLESIGTLAGGIAHDLNNTLVPILMSASLLRMRYPNEAEMIDTVEASAKRAANMVRQLLTFAKGIEGARLLVHSQQLLTEMEKIIRSTFPKNIELRISLPASLEPVRGDATQLHQVLLNLCVNARDAMPGGGILALGADNADITAADTAMFTSPDAKPGRYIVWRVRDCGSGIPAEIIERIFEPFFSTKGPDKGSGLGLSTVLGIIKSHGGFVHVDSVQRSGSTFSVYLPAAGTATSVEPPPTTPEVELRGNGEVILVVDDEVAVRNVCSAVLKALNFKVVTAADGTEALGVAAEHRKELRAIITDLHMPHMDGLTFVSVLRHILPQTEIIVASGRMEEQKIAAFNALGVYAFLDKPFTQQQLMEVLGPLLCR